MSEMITLVSQYKQKLQKRFCFSSLSKLAGVTQSCWKTCLMKLWHVLLKMSTNNFFDSCFLHWISYLGLCCSCKKLCDDYTELKHLVIIKKRKVHVCFIIVIHFIMFMDSIYLSSRRCWANTRGGWWWGDGAPRRIDQIHQEQTAI